MTYSFVKRRLLTEEEKYRRAIFYYTFHDYSFEHIYEDENNLNDEYGQPLLNTGRKIFHGRGGNSRPFFVSRAPLYCE